MQENVSTSAFKDAPGKRAAPWSASGSNPKHAKSALAPRVTKGPLQPSQLNVAANLDTASQAMGPPPPKKPPTQEQIAQAQACSSRMSFVVSLDVYT